MLATMSQPAPSSRRTRPAPAASPLTGLQIGYLEALDSREQVRIFDLSVRAARTLHKWAARYPLIRRERVWPLALSVAAAAPFSSVDALISTARLSLWVFTLDDLFDEERVPHAELTRRAERYRAIASGQSVQSPEDSLATALQEIRDDLAKYPLFQPLGEVWAAALRGTIDGMAQEYQWRIAYRTEGAAALPSYTDYVATGLYSIGGPPHIWAAVITANDQTVLRHIPAVRAMEELACTCIRLANDLQSYRKELVEGKINALVLLTQNHRRQGMSLDEAHPWAEAQVRAHIARDLQRLATLQAAPRSATGRPEAAIAHIARFVCDFYTQHDYHTISLKAG